LIRRDVRVRVTEPRRALARREVARTDVREPARLRVDERDVDELAFAGPGGARIARVERRENADARVDAARDVGHRRREAARSAVGWPGERHESGLTLRDDVVAPAIRLRSRVAVAADRAVDEAGVLRVQCVGIESRSRQRIQPRIVREKHVGARHELVQHCEIVGTLDVDLDATLVAIHGKEVRALALEKRRSPTARLVAGLGPLHFDHVGTEIAEHHRAIGTCERLRHVDDFDSGQGCDVSHECSELCSIIAR